MGDGNRKLLGRVAVAAKLITIDQLNDALREQGRRIGSPNIGEILVAMGFMTPADLERAIDLQKRVVAKARSRSAPAPSAPSEDGLPPGADRVAPEPARSERKPPSACETAVPESATQASRPRAAPAIDSSRLDQILRAGVEAGASDIHIHSGAAIRLRVCGAFFDHGSSILSADEARDIVLYALSPEDREVFNKDGEIDLCYRLGDVGRFRTNIYRQLRGIDGIFRFIPPEPPTLDQLGLPSSLARFTSFHQGMVLITGPTGSGKSTTLAALVNLINEERREHILTIEDPIEYLHPSKRCLVNQRSVKKHTHSFACALRAALREDPDVIVIGELRDRETISLALSAAETGHFVLATLHTDSAIRTIRRLIGAFAPDQQEQVRAMLSESLKAVISQRLVPRADEVGMVAALEILVVNRAVGNMIRENKTVQMASVLQTGASQGMCLLDNSLAQLVSAKTISREDALRCCADPKRIPS